MQDLAQEYHCDASEITGAFQADGLYEDDQAIVVYFTNDSAAQRACPYYNNAVAHKNTAVASGNVMYATSHRAYDCMQFANTEVSTPENAYDKTVYAAVQNGTNLANNKSFNYYVKISGIYKQYQTDAGLNYGAGELKSDGCTLPINKLFSQNGQSDFSELKAQGLTDGMVLTVVGQISKKNNVVCMDVARVQGYGSGCSPTFLTQSCINLKSCGYRIQNLPTDKNSFYGNMIGTNGMLFNFCAHSVATGEDVYVAEFLESTHATDAYIRFRTSSYASQGYQADIINNRYVYVAKQAGIEAMNNGSPQRKSEFPTAATLLMRMQKYGYATTGLSQEDIANYAIGCGCATSDISAIYKCSAIGTADFATVVYCSSLDVAVATYNYLYSYFAYPYYYAWSENVAFFATPAAIAAMFDLGDDVVEDIHKVESNGYTVIAGYMNDNASLATAYQCDTSDIIWSFFGYKPGNQTEIYISCFAWSGWAESAQNSMQDQTFQRQYFYRSSNKTLWVTTADGEIAINSYGYGNDKPSRLPSQDQALATMANQGYDVQIFSDSDVAELVSLLGLTTSDVVSACMAENDTDDYLYLFYCTSEAAARKAYDHCVGIYPQFYSIEYSGNVFCFGTPVGKLALNGVDASVIQIANNLQKQGLFTFVYNTGWTADWGRDFGLEQGDILADIYASRSDIGEVELFVFKTAAAAQTAYEYLLAMCGNVYVVQVRGNICFYGTPAACDLIT